MEEWKAAIGAACREVRGEHDSQSEFAELTGVSQKTILNIENGNTNYRIDKLLKLLNARRSNPVKKLLEIKFVSSSVSQMAIHVALQELMDKFPNDRSSRQAINAILLACETLKISLPPDLVDT